jgi:ATP-dependent DNA ligase
MDQAKSQMQSDWARKRDEGYKSLNDLDELQADRLYTPSDPKDLKELLEKFLPKFNTDASGNVKPMLATDWKKVKKIDYPVLLQPKLDGVRCLMVSQDGDVTFFSRSGKEYTTLNHIKTDVMKYQNAHPDHNWILDGEIYSDELTFQEITQAVKKQYPNSLKLHFRAYDVVNDRPQVQRIQDVSALVSTINSNFIHMVSTIDAEHEDHVKFHHDTWVGSGYEGAMIRMANGKYAQGHRSRELLKVKEFDEAEFTFIRWDKGQRDEDLLAVCEIENKTFKAKMEGSRELKKRLESMFTGGKMTIKHFGWTSDGLPRFPIGKGFRDDGE